MSQFSIPYQILLIAMATERLGIVAVLPHSIQCIFRLIKEFWNFLLPVRALRSVVFCEWAVQPNGDWRLLGGVFAKQSQRPLTILCTLEMIHISSYFYLLQLSTWLH